MANDMPFVLKCGCGRCSFDDCLAKRATEKIPAWTHPDTMGCFSFLKEVSSGAGVPGLSSSFGALLVIVNQIASMENCKLDLRSLMQNCIDSTAVVAIAVQWAKDIQESKGIAIPQSFHAQAREFSQVLTSIEKLVKQSPQRGWFTRLLHAKAERVEIGRLRQRMDDEIQNFMRRRRAYSIQTLASPKEEPQHPRQTSNNMCLNRTSGSTQNRLKTSLRGLANTRLRYSKGDTKPTLPAKQLPPSYLATTVQAHLPMSSTHTKASRIMKEDIPTAEILTTALKIGHYRRYSIYEQTA
ncbi:hypothetical protein BKA70DRAFT_849552 [Coprinopsis sp. MPI-PUGE-AT-0042]|nr:hypothetical protein BKA70DRAFT_849552 [Coprinopsis sp. MPI-PUGE-AT-0042]